MPYDPFYNVENPELLEYEYAWVTFVKTGTMPGRSIPTEIAESWKRCRAAGVNPKIEADPSVFVDEAELNARCMRRHLFVEAATRVIRDLLNAVEEDDLQSWITDETGVVLYEADKENHRKNPPMAGKTTDETAEGTTSSQLALSLQKPVRVAGAQHYCQIYHDHACYAAPVIVDESLIGAIGARVRCENMNRYMLALVAMAARTISDELTLMHSNEQIRAQDTEKREIMDRIRDGIVYVDAEDRISFVNDGFLRISGVRSASVLIGKPLSELTTDPPLTSIPEATNYADSTHVALVQRKERIQCVVTKKTFSAGGSGEKNEPGNENKIFIFVEFNDIHDLADRANPATKAFFTFDMIIGESPAIRDTIEMARKAADYDASVILEGESGTGKEMLAQSIHNAGRHVNGPFVAVDCGAIPRELIESELFGYEEGAFTGARKGGSRGKFELANHGTLFLDEIENFPLDMQMKLLRALQERKIVRVGGSREIPFTTRIIAASNRDLAEEVRLGRFREDLYYRLNIMQIHLPPLRERREDIPRIAEHEIATFNRSMKRSIVGIDADAMQILMDFSWPGNVRQLNNVLERMIILSDGPMLGVETIPEEILRQEQKEAQETFSPLAGSPEMLTEEQILPLSQAEATYTARILRHYDGNIKRTSEALKISRSTVYRLLEKSGAPRRGGK